MARPKHIDRPASLNTQLPSSLHTRLSLWLWSDAEGRVPKGAYSKFFAERIRVFFDHKALDLGPFIGSLPGEHVISGPTHTIDAILRHLKGEVK